MSTLTLSAPPQVQSGPNPDLCGWRASSDHTSPTPPVEAEPRLPIKPSEAATHASRPERTAAPVGTVSGAPSMPLLDPAVL